VLYQRTIRITLSLTCISFIVFGSNSLMKANPQSEIRIAQESTSSSESTGNPSQTAESYRQCLTAEITALEPIPTSPIEITNLNTRTRIRTVRITGSTLLATWELSDIRSKIEEFLDNENKMAQIRQEFETEFLNRNVVAQAIASAITDIYLNGGFITSDASVQSISDGVLSIEVTEGSLAEIRILGTERLIGYLCDRIQLGADIPLSTTALEDQLRLLLSDPLIDNIEATLKPIGNSNNVSDSSTRQPRQSILDVRVTLNDPLEGTISLDNYSPPSVGSQRLGINLTHRNLTDIGDAVSYSYYHSSTGGSDILNLSYRVPLNPMDGSLTFQIAPQQNRVTLEELEELNLRGESEQYSITYRQPLIRTPREESALFMGFEFQNGQTFVFNQLPTPFTIGPDENGVSRTSVFTFGQDYVHRDSQGAWSLTMQFNIGTGLFEATTNEADIPDGQFFSWIAQLQRVQRLNDNHVLIIRGDLQLTPDTLLPAHQFVIGGAQSLRGYRQNARSGDNGFRFSIEDRITLERDGSGTPILLLAPFWDMGLVWNHPDNPNLLPDNLFLMSLGASLIIEPESPLSFRFDVGVPLNPLDDRQGDDPQDGGIHFSILQRL
jgi:hemolysin activation/secretion protein